VERPERLARLARPCLIAGLLFFLISGVAALKRADFAGNFVTIPGTVAEIATLAGASGAPSYSPVYQFKDEMGRVWRIHAVAGPSRPDVSPGQPVVLRYPIGNPGAAQVLGGRGQWAPILAGLGAGIVLIAVGIASSGRRRSRYRAAQPPSPGSESH
jgi:hypothetical protein